MKESEVRKMLDDHRLELVSLVRNKHWKAKVRNASGKQYTVTFPNSHSDHRALKNKAAQLVNMSSGAY